MSKERCRSLIPEWSVNHGDSNKAVNADGYMRYGFFITPVVCRDKTKAECHRNDKPAHARKNLRHLARAFSCFLDERCCKSDERGCDRVNK